MAAGQLIDLIEFRNEATGQLATVEHVEYGGIEERSSDGQICLTVRKPGGARRQFINTSFVIAVTVNGTRHELEVSERQGKIRGQEIGRIIEGYFPDNWAEPYFDEGSPKYHKYNQLQSAALASLSSGYASVDLQLDKTTSKPVQIVYLGSGGDTERVIKPLSISGVLTFDRNVFTVDAVTARCELRKSQRTFIMERIAEVMDLDTGELMLKSEWAKTLPVQKGPLEDLVRYHREFMERFGRDKYDEAEAQPTHEASPLQPKSSLGSAILLLGGIALALLVLRWLVGA